MIKNRGIKLLCLCLLMALIAGCFSGIAVAETWNCPNCGATAEGNFCSNCGGKKPENNGAWFCPNCGRFNTSNFCAYCGTARDGGSSGGQSGNQYSGGQRTETRANYLGRSVISLGSAYANDYYTYEKNGSRVPYYPANAFDNNESTCWLSYAYSNTLSGIFVGNSWTLAGNYRNSYNAYGIVIRTGLQTRGMDSFIANSRPETVNVTINGASQTFTLDDTMNEQYLYFFNEISPVNGRFDVEVTITTVYTGNIGSGQTNRNGQGRYAIAVSDIDLILMSK